jgi:PKD repeat protein
MKRACLLLLPAMLLIALAAPGCNDHSKPIFTRVRVSPACGVAPLSVEGFAAVSGGNESGDPMGGTNLLEVTWDFGDGGTSSTSISYHEYAVRDSSYTYTVTVTAKDPDGNIATASVPVIVMPDSLVVTATASNNTPAIGERVQFDMTAIACAVNYPTVPGDSVKMSFFWEIMGTASVDTFYGAGPSFTFDTDGHYDVRLAATYPAEAVTRSVIIPIDVPAPLPLN